MTYVVIEDQTYPTDTIEQIAAAQAALGAAGLASTPVIVSPLASLEELEQYGDPESYASGQVLYS